jgi:DNA replication protein DnaC
MDDTLRRELLLVGFHHLAENWEAILKEATRHRPSYHRFLQAIVHEEYHRKTEKIRLARLKRAKIPQLFVMDTFPFHRQPRLKKQLVLQLYDSLSYMTEHQDLIFIGPTGCGKTGLATAFLVHAVNQGFRGLFIDFSDLLERLYRSRGEYNEAKVMRKYCAYDVMVIDEIGYIAAHKEQAGLFFDLMRRRHQRKTTIITTQLLCAAAHSS